MKQIYGINPNPEISKAFYVLYALLLKEQIPEAEEVLGYVAQAQAIWDNEGND